MSEVDVGLFSPVNLMSPNPTRQLENTLHYNLKKKTPLSRAQSVDESQEWGESHTGSFYPLYTEWIDQRGNGGSKFKTKANGQVSNIIESKSETSRDTDVNDSVKRFDTPSKVKVAAGDISGTNKTFEEIINDSLETKSVQLDDDDKLHESINSIDIFWGMFNQVVGKDKMAKVGQYLLRLLLHHCARTQLYLSDEDLNMKTITEAYFQRGDKLKVVMYLMKSPRDFLRIFVILMCSIFTERFKILSDALAMFRRLLRFGKSPYRFLKLFTQIKECFAPDTRRGKIGDRLSQHIFRKDFLNELIAFYYNIFDEILLLDKVRLLRSAPLNKVATRHAAIAWYMESTSAIVDSYKRILSYNEQEMEMKIQIQVRHKAKIISKQLLNSNTLDLPENLYLLTEELNKKILKNIQFKKKNSYIDFYKALSDLLFNTYDVFELPLSFDTVQIWLGVSASSLSTIKLYRETEMSLMEKNHQDN